MERHDHAPDARGRARRVAGGSLPRRAGLILCSRTRVANRRRYFDRFALAVVVVGVVVGLWTYAHDPRNLDDFLTYWTVGRLNVQGRNPYDAETVLALERSVGWTKPFAYRIWYPPWTVALFMPLGLLSFPVARFAWYVACLVAIVGSADWLWCAYGGPASRRGRAWLVAATFWPAVVVCKTGQVAPVILVGIVGLLACMRANRPIAAGTALALAAAKPLLAYLIWPALVLSSLRRRDLRALGSFGMALLALTGVALWANPRVLDEYVRVTWTEPPHLLPPPYVLPSALGTLLRQAAMAVTGTDSPALQFVPMPLGTLWLIWYWRRRGPAWSWLDDMPAVLVASFAFASWCWMYDETLLLVPLVGVAALSARPSWGRSERRLVGAYVVVDLLILIANVARAPATSYAWTQYVLLGLYLAAPAPTPAPSELPEVARGRTRGGSTWTTRTSGY
jgi:hypothetical protein